MKKYILSSACLDLDRFTKFILKQAKNIMKIKVIICKLYIAYLVEKSINYSRSKDPTFKWKYLYVWKSILRQGQWEQVWS